MARTIDERIVDAQFNNKQFEDGIKTSIASLDKFKGSLNSATEGNQFSLSGLTTGVEKVAGSFSTLGIIAMTTLQNITNKVINAGEQLVKSLTIDPVMSGFREYELKMGSIQTIMAGTGAPLEEVNARLEELNLYADRTIYSFSDMTANIGKFTNAGVKLDQSVEAIQGISNLAALSGANANEASRAMYNFSQALSAGFVKLIDWKSIENANMATVDFKEQLLDMAVAAGTAEKQANGMYKVLTTSATGSTMPQLISATKNFNDSLQYQWMTTDVLIPTLQKYVDETTDLGKRAFAAAQDVKTFTQMIDTLQEGVGSGWATTSELIFGDFETAKVFWTDIGEILSDLFVKSGEIRNDLLSIWAREGGQAMGMESIINVLKAINVIVKTIGEAFDEIFPVTARHLLNITETIRNFTERLILSGDATDKLRSIFKGLFSAVRIIIDVLGVLFNVFGKILGAISPIGGGIVDLIVKIADFITNFQESEKITKVFETALTAIGLIITWLQKQISTAISIILPIISTIISSVGNGVSSINSKFQEFSGMTIVETFMKIFESIGKIISWIGDKITIVLDRIKYFFNEVNSINSEPMANFFNGLSSSFNVFSIVANIFTASIDLIGKALEKAWPYLQQMGSMFGSSLKEIAALLLNFTTSLGTFGLNSLVSLLEGMIKLIPTAMQKIGEGVIILIQMLIDSIPLITQLIIQIVQAIAIVVAELAPEIAKSIIILLDEILTVLDEYSPNILNKIFSILLTVLQGIKNNIGAISDAILDIVINLISSLINKIKELANSVGIDSDLIDKLFNPTMLAIVILTIKKFIDSISNIIDNSSNFIDGITNIFDSVSGAIDGFTNSLNSKALLNIAIALGVLAASLLVISFIPINKLLPALAGITVLFTELSLVMLLLSKGIGDVKLGGLAIAMIEISIAVLILAQAFKQLSTLSYEQIGAGIVAITVLFGELALFTKIVSGSELTKIGLALIVVSAAILILTQGVKQLSDLNWKNLFVGLTGIGVLLLALAGFSKIVKPGQLLITGLAMTPLAEGLNILTDAVLKLSTLKVEELIKGLSGILAMLLSLTIVSKIVNPIAILALGAAMIPLGIGMVKMVEAMDAISNLNWEDIAKGIVGIAGVLLALAGASQIANPISLLALAGALIVVSSALIVIADVMLNSFAQMSWGEIGKSIIMLAGSLLILAAAAKIIGVDGATGSIGILIMATALTILTPSLMAFGNMPLENIGKALLMLVGVFAIFAIAGYALGPVAPILLILGEAIIMFGIGIVALSGALLIAAAAINLFALAGPEGAEALSAILIAIIDLIPYAIQKLGEGLLILLKTLSDAIPLILNIITKIIMGIIDTIITLSPAIVDLIFFLLTMLLQTIDEYLPDIVAAGLSIIIAILDGINKNIFEIIAIALEIVANLLKGLADGLPKIIAAAVELVGALIIAIGNEIPNLIDAGFKMIIDFVNGIADAIRENTGPLVEAAMNLGSAILEGLVDGIFAAVGGVGSTIVNVGNSILDGFKGFFGIKSPSRLMKEKIGMPIGAGIGEGIESSAPETEESVDKFSTKIFGAFDKHSEKFKNAGSDIGSNVAKGIEESEPEVTNASEKTGTGIINTLKSVFSGGDIGSSLTDNISTNIESGTPDVAKAATDMSDKTFEEAVKWIDEYKKSTDYLIADELKMWENMQLDYKLGSDERVEIDKNVMQLKKLILAEEFKNESTHIRKLRDERIISAEEEFEEWKKIQNKYKTGTDERTEIEKELSKFQNETKQDEIGASNTVANTKTKNAATERKSNEQIAAEKKKQLTDELAQLKELSTQYEVNSRKRIEIDVKIENVRKELLKESEKDRQHQLEVDKRFIETRKENTNLSIVDEIKMWQEAAVKYDELSKERIEIDDRITQLRFSNDQEAITNRLAWYEVSTQEELKMWENLQNQYKKNSEERLAIDKQIADLRTQITLESFMAEKKAWTEKEKIGEKTLENELNYWQQIQGQYKKGSDERMVIDAYIADVKDQISQETFDAEKKYIQNHVDWAKTSTEEEINLWKNLQSKYKEGSEEREEIDSRIADLEIKLDNETFKNRMSNIQEARKEQRMSAEEELSALLDLAGFYKFTSEERAAIDERIAEVQNEIRNDQFKAEKKVIQDRVDWIQTSTAEELELWRNLQSQYKKGSEERAEIDAIITDLEMKNDKEVFNSNMKHIKQARNENRISFDEEISMLKDLSKQYKIGSEERLEIDAQIEDTQKEQFDWEKKQIAAKRNLHKLSLQEEFNIWKSYQDKYAMGTEERKQADQGMIDAIIGHRQLGNISLQEEYRAWKVIQDLYIEGSDERIKIELELQDVLSRIRKDQFETDKKYVTNRRNLEGMSLRQELTTWEIIQSRYVEGSEERKKAEQGMIDAIIAHREMDNLSLQEEYSSWLSIQNKYAVGTEERIQIEYQLQDVLKRAAKERANIQKEMDNLEQKYADSVKDRANQLMNTFGLFDKINKKEEEVVGKDLITNLKDQVSEVETWSKNIEKLAERGIEEGILEELRKMGPNANAEITALTKMTDKELDQYNELWAKKVSLTTEIATDEYANLRTQTDQEIARLQDTFNRLNFSSISHITQQGVASASAFTNGFVIELSNSSQQIADAPTDALKSNAPSYSEIGVTSGDNFATGLESTKPEATEAGEIITDTAEAAVTDGITPFESLGVKAGSDFIDGIKRVHPDSQQAGELLVEAAYTGMRNMVVDIYNLGFEIGAQFAQGFAAGIYKEIQAAIVAAKTLAEEAIAEIKADLEINSPSKVTQWLGEQTGQGFIDGIGAMINKVYEPVHALGNSAMEAMKEAISNISDVVDSDINLHPTITPVLDLTEIQNGRNSLSKMLTGDDIELPIMKNITGIVRQTGGKDTSRIMGEAKKGEGDTYEFKQYNYSPTALSRVEIYRQTRNQFAQLKGAAHKT